jgi:hypothetical protein
MSFPVRSGAKGVPNRLRNGRRRCECEPEENHSRGSEEIVLEGERTEVRVEREQDPVLLLSTSQEHFIVCVGMGSLRSGDIVVVLPKSVHDVAGDILVDEKTH